MTTEQFSGPLVETDRGRRAADLINMYRNSLPYDDLKTKWMAFRLEDGSSDGNIYDTCKEAIDHQKFEQECWYVSFVNLVAGATAGDCERMLAFYAYVYKRGGRFVPPVNGKAPMQHVIPTATTMDNFRHDTERHGNRAMRREFQKAQARLHKAGYRP
jgi:hypothetical protein